MNALLFSLPLLLATVIAGPARAQTVPAGQHARHSAALLPPLVNSPGTIVATQLGGTQQLRVFLDDPTGQFEVTALPGTTYQSSNAGIVSVSSSGLMTFVAAGSAQITSGHGSQTAITTVNVNPGGMPSVSASIGTGGGSVHLSNGTGVSLPPGALPSTQTVSVTAAVLPGGTSLPPGATLVGSAYDFGPTGLTFSAAASVAIAFDAGSVPAGYDPASVLVHQLLPGNVLGIEAYTGPDGDEQAIESVNQSIDASAGCVIANVHHFSCRALLATLAPTPVVLVAPDGTRLQVLRRLKTQQPSKGADLKYGRPFCDDNGDGNVDDCGEFEMNGPTCPPGAVDDVAVAPAVRPAANITHIVLHSTAGAAGSTFNGEVSWASDRRNCYWAHYYVGKDGTIVQISEDTTVAQHVKPNSTAGHAGNGINNDNAIGIEIFSNTGVQNYPGRQVAAVVRLVDFLLRAHATIARPSATDLDGNVITHAAQNPPGSVKSDPTEQFRTAVMGSPSLEEIVLRALRTDTLTGIVNTRGGDANGTGIPGNGGVVLMEMGVTALANDFADSRTSIQVATGATQAIVSGDRMHLLVNGTATVSADVLLDLDGILYVGPNGVLDARGGFDGNNAHRVEFTADGFAFIEGRVLVNGTDKLGTELPPWTQPPFGGGTGPGNGGHGAEFRFRSAAGGFLWVPSIVTRGGDADSSPAGVRVDGGNGGSVTVRGSLNAASDDVFLLVRGKANAPETAEHQSGMPDYMPQPSPFNWMPIIVASPIASGTCHVDPFSNLVWLRPLANERLAMGRSIDPTTRVVGANVSAFSRGIITCGGVGANPPNTTTAAGVGGNGGAIVMQNSTSGYVRFLDNVQLFSGSGAERFASVIFVVGGGCDDNKFFNLPSGGTGGRGPFSGGSGGQGGNGGSVTITGRLWPNTLTAGPPASITSTAISGFNSDDPRTSGGAAIGTLKSYPTEGFATSSTKGSGGSPAGNASGSPGFFGPSGANGTTIINGTTVFP